jgi:hypothetical protein
LLRESFVLRKVPLISLIRSLRRMHWKKELAYVITPRSGPVRAMATLLDANRAIIEDLPHGWIKRPHWRQAGWRLIEAADSGVRTDISDASELVLDALNREGWMSRNADQPWSGARLPFQLEHAPEPPPLPPVSRPVSYPRPTLEIRLPQPPAEIARLLHSLSSARLAA